MWTGLWFEKEETLGQMFQFNTRPTDALELCYISVRYLSQPDFDPTVQCVSSEALVCGGTVPKNTDGSKENEEEVLFVCWPEHSRPPFKPHTVCPMSLQSGLS